MKEIWIIIDTQMHSYEALLIEQAFTTKEFAQDALNDYLDQMDIPRSEADDYIIIPLSLVK